jgi:spore coat polysaccharide biosynthesis protein SpsF (cytidylyltransferase family)
METATIIETLKKELSKVPGGMSIQDFESLAKKFGFTSVRATEINGKAQLATRDYNINRINVKADAPVISTEIVKIGKKQYLEEKYDYLKLTVTGIINVG